MDSLGNTLLFGAEFQRQKGKKWGKYGDVANKTDIYSFYLNDQFLLLDDSLVLSLGLRNDHHKEFGNQVTGKAGVSYTIQATHTTPYLNYGTSFKAPTFFNLYDPKYGNINLEPEKGKTWEIGIRQSLLQNRVKLECSYWYTKLDNVIAFVYGINLNPTIRGMYSNRDK